MNTFNLVLLISAICLFSSCKKTEPPQPESKYIEVVFKIPCGPINWIKDGAVYKDQYLVWTQDESMNRRLISYNLVDRVVAWDHDFNHVPGFGQKMQIHENVLVGDKYDYGIFLFNLDDRELVTKYRYDSIPGYTSRVGATFYGNKVYKASVKPYEGLAFIMSLDIHDGTFKNEYSWSQPTDKKVFPSSPLVYYNSSSERLNLIMVMHLIRLYGEPNSRTSTHLISVNEDQSVNWIDSITAGPGAVDYLPIMVGDDVIAHSNDLLISNNSETGERNWNVSTSDGSRKLIKMKDYTYYNSGSSLIRFNAESGSILWKSSIFAPPSTIGDFEVVNDEVVYVNERGSGLVVLNNDNGKFFLTNYRDLGNVANPKYHEELDLFITHNNYEIIGFRLK